MYKTDSIVCAADAVYAATASQFQPVRGLLIASMHKCLVIVSRCGWVVDHVGCE